MRAIVSAILVLAVVGGIGALVYGVATAKETVVQPITFNHVVHLEKAALECQYCHTDAESSVYAGLPGKDICLDCHDIDEEDATPPAKAAMFAYVDLEEDIPWKRVAVTNPDVFFSHRRHVGAAKLDCLQCHTDQRTLVAPPTTARLVMAMDDCLACHEENGVSTDCLACHR